MKIECDVANIGEAMKANPDAPYIVMTRHVAKELCDGYLPRVVEAPPRKWDVMLDLETWGLRPGSALRSIGAVCFDPNSDATGGAFYTTVHMGGQSGLTTDAATKSWWDDQPPETQALLYRDQISLDTAAFAFCAWWRSVNGGNLWAHGAAFDPPMLAVAMNAVDLDAPWDYRAVRDTRTLYALAGFDPKTVPNVGVAHHALDDARCQAVCVQAAMRKLRTPWGAVCGRPVG